jgi:hypothetical protein
LAGAQNWAGILAPSRAIDWSQAGAGVIPNRTYICATLNPGATSSDINSAISACSTNGAALAANGGVVFLNAGTYSGLGAITTKSNVTLRGAGADKTLLVFSSGSGCNGLGSDVCTINADNNYSGSPHNTAIWTAGYSKGTTSITLSSYANLRVGSLLILDQLDDPGTDPGDQIWVCSSTSCSQQGITGINGRSGRAQNQQVTVVSCGTSTYAAACTSGNITISPGLYSPNWTAAKSPGAWYSSAVPITGVGIEDMSLDHSSVTNQNGSGIMFTNATNSWVRGIRAINAGSNNKHKHVWLYQSSHITIRDSYFYGSNAASESYGVDCGSSSSDNLIENNIFQHIATANINEGATGCVFGYNYAVDNNYNNGAPSWQQEDAYHHSTGDYYMLWEGHVGTGLTADDIHGSSWMGTAFRNRYSGRDTGTEYAPKTQNTNAIHVYATNRYWNFIGNVLGTAGYHTRYSWEAQSASDPGSSTTNDRSVFSLGYSGNEGTRAGFDNDLRAISTTMRWGNYDTVNNAVRWQSSEVPSADPMYPNAVPASNTLPPSFYLNAKPSWWVFPSGNASTPWPGIGPDVAGGNIPSVGGYAYLNPAGNCYLKVMGGLTDGSTGVLTFNAANCYGSSFGGGGNAPNAPSGLTSIVQ